MDRAAQIIREQDLAHTFIIVCVDSLAALKVLESDTIRSDYLRGCIETLTRISQEPNRMTGRGGVRSRSGKGKGVG